MGFIREIIEWIAYGAEESIKMENQRETNRLLKEQNQLLRQKNG